jgi:hypothetical protein
MVMRYENVGVYTVSNGVSDMGEQTYSEALWFETRGRVADVANTLRISERYRVYSDLLSITLNYTPNTRTIVDNQDQYTFRWREKYWRVTDCREHNDRQFVTFICYRSDPTMPV